MIQGVHGARERVRSRRGAFMKSAGSLSLLGLGLLLVLYGIHRHRLFDPPPELSFGQKMNPIEIVGERGQTLNLTAGSWHLLISGSHKDLQLAEYLSRLMDASQQGTSLLRPFVLIDDEHETVKEFEFRNFLPFPVHALHSFEHQDLVELGLRGHDRAYALISPGLEVVFASEYLQPNDLRLLLEKHLRIVRRRVSRPLEPGDRLPSVPLSQEAGPVEGPGTDGGGRTWIVFTSQCVTCSLQNQMELLATHQELLGEWSRNRGLSLAVVFSETFDRPDLIAKLDQLKIDRVPIFLAGGPLEGLEDAYLKRSLHGDDVLMVQADREGTVVEIRSFRAWVASLEIAGSGEGVPP